MRLSPAIFGPVQTWVNAALSFFYPDVCQYCEREDATRNDGFVGPACRQRVKFIDRPFCEQCGCPFHGEITVQFQCSNCRDLELRFSKARSAVLAEGMVLDIIHQYKYNRALWFETFLCELLVQRAAPQMRCETWDMIVPVPLHRLKQSQREFNQAERLARTLSAATGITLKPRVLQRILPTRTQTRLSRKGRLDNVRKAFALYPNTRLNGKRIVLVDDVFTTGATTSACATALLEGGADEVCVWTLARGGLR